MKSGILAMTARHHKKIQEHLFPGDGLEASAIMLCNQGTGVRHQRLIVAEILYLPHQRCVRQRNSIIWPFSDYLPAEKISDVDQNGQSIVTIHSHPQGHGRFSKIDDQNDRELFKSANHWFNDGRLNGSAIMLPNGKVTARSVNTNGEFQNIEAVIVVGDNIQIWKSKNQGRLAAYEQKLAQTFGTGTLELLRTLRVGVVGCSGTGSIIIELLARNCVQDLVLIDHDVVEAKNLNRIVNSTRKAVDKKQSKVEAISDAIHAMGLDTKVKAIQGQTDSRKVVQALADCDIIFGCTDTAYGRYHLDCLASAYLIPYFDVGVNLEANGVGGVSAADAVSHYVHPEGDSLLSRSAYNMDQVTAELWYRNDRETYEQRYRAGYLIEVGDEQPAVISLNMQAACMAFNDFLDRIHRFRLDDSSRFSSQCFRLVHGHHEHSNDNGTPHKLLYKYVGYGDSSLLVKNNTTRD